MSEPTEEITAYATASELTAPPERSGTPGEDYTLPTGAVVRIRPLTRGEAHRFAGREMPVSQVEQKMLSMALVAPAMSEADVRKWMDNAAAGDFEGIIARITKISGMEPKAEREAAAQFPG